MKSRNCFGFLAFMLLGACGTMLPQEVAVKTETDPSTQVEPPETPSDPMAELKGPEDTEQPQRPKLTGPAARKEVQAILGRVRSQLNDGNEAKAREELDYAMLLDAGNKEVACLLKGVTGDPMVLLGKASVNYTVRSGDTLGNLAQRVLGDTCEFYLLARYAGVANPGKLSAGLSLRLPENPSSLVLVRPPTSAPKPPSQDNVAKPSEQPVVPVAHQPPKLSPAEAKSLVDRYRARAENALTNHQLDEALRAWNALLAIDPLDKNALVRHDYTLGLKRKWDELNRTGR